MHADTISYMLISCSSWEKLKILQLSLCLTRQHQFPNTDLNQSLLSEAQMRYQDSLYLQELIYTGKTAPTVALNKYGRVGSCSTPTGTKWKFET